MGTVYWCAACGNPNIIVESTHSGYSMAKGIVGAAILGPVGAVAGVNGKEASVFYCPKCGARLNHSMPDYEIDIICNLLNNPEINRDLLESKRKRYPNMIWPKELEDSDSKVARINTKLSEKPEEVNSVIKQEPPKNVEFLIVEYLAKAGIPVKEGPLAAALDMTDNIKAVNDAVAALKEHAVIESVYVDDRKCIVLTAQAEDNFQETINFVKGLGEESRLARIKKEYEDAREEYENAVTSVEEKKKAEYKRITDSFFEDIARKKAECEAKHNQQIHSLDYELEQALKDLDLAKKELSQLKLYQANRKKELTQYIEKRSADIDLLTRLKNEENYKYTEALAELDLQATEKELDTLELVDKMFPDPVAPEKPRELWTQAEIENHEFKERIIKAIGFESLTATDVSQRLGISLAKSTALLTQLVHAGKLEREVRNKVAFFSLKRNTGSQKSEKPQRVFVQESKSSAVSDYLQSSFISQNTTLQSQPFDAPQAERVEKEKLYQQNISEPFDEGEITKIAADPDEIVEDPSSNINSSLGAEINRGRVEKTTGNYPSSGLSISDIIVIVAIPIFIGLILIFGVSFLETKKTNVENQTKSVYHRVSSDRADYEKAEEVITPSLNDEYVTDSNEIERDVLWDQISPDLNKIIQLSLDDAINSEATTAEEIIATIRKRDNNIAEQVELIDKIKSACAGHEEYSDLIINLNTIKNNVPKRFQGSTPEAAIEWLESYKEFLTNSEEAYVAVLNFTRDMDELRDAHSEQGTDDSGSTKTTGNTLSTEQAQYEKASEYFTNGDYKSAQTAFTQLGSYSDSKDMALESEYLYAKQLLQAASPDRRTIDKCFEHLITENYKDSFDIYDQLDKDWRATVFLGSGQEYPLRSLAKDEDLDIRCKVFAKRTLSEKPIYEFRLPDGEVRTGEFEDYSEWWCYRGGIWEDPSSAPSGTFMVRVLDSTGKIHGQASIYIGD